MRNQCSHKGALEHENRKFHRLCKPNISLTDTTCCHSVWQLWTIEAIDTTWVRAWSLISPHPSFVFVGPWEVKWENQSENWLTNFGPWYDLRLPFIKMKTVNESYYKLKKTKKSGKKSWYGGKVYRVMKLNPIINFASEDLSGPYWIVVMDCFRIVFSENSSSSL